MKTLVIAEKPSVGRDIGKVLKCNEKADGYIFNEKYIVSWAIGHLVTLFEPEDYNLELKKWSMSFLPIIPEEIKLKPIDKTKKQFKILSILMNKKDVDKIICATDSGREGELIFRYIYNIVKCKKKFYRLWISSMTNEAIKEGFLNLKEGSEYNNLYYSAKCRSEADWLVGINSSRAFTLKFNELLSIGRVQTPTLAILVNRQNEINSFVSKDYFEIEALFKSICSNQVYKGIYINKEHDTKIFDIEELRKIAYEISNKNGIVKSIEKEVKKQPHPLLYDLTELQRDCNKRFGLSAQRTLNIVQDLYEKRKLITYPRTDSRFLTEDMIPKLKGILQKLSTVYQYSEFCNFVLDNNKVKITKRIVNNSKVTDHHAIVPTNVSPKIESLSNDEFKVYNLIVFRFICVFYPEYIYNITKVITQVEGHNFLTKGKTIIQKGWTILNSYLEKEDEDEEIPKVVEGEEVNLLSFEELKKKTTPPKNYTEATLLSAMENAGRFVEDEEIKESIKDSGLGTPATRASIIERLIKVGYVKRKSKLLIPTDKGMKLIQLVPIELKSPEMTGKWEKGLLSISKGNMNSDKFMKSIDNYVHYIVKYAKTIDSDINFANDKDNKFDKSKIWGKCPYCKNNILENSKSFYCSSWKNGCKFSIWKNTFDKWKFEINQSNIKDLLEKHCIEEVELINPNNNNKVKCNVILQDFKEGGLCLKIIKDC